jgi:hypothetical protein
MHMLSVTLMLNAGLCGPHFEEPCNFFWCKLFTA